MNNTSDWLEKIFEKLKIDTLHIVNDVKNQIYNKYQDPKDAKRL
jgi:hypothetical protein